MAREKKRRVGLKIIAICVLLICGVVVYGKIQLDREYKEREEYAKRLEREIKKEESRAVDIAEYSAYVKTKKYIEDIARMLGLVYPDEIIIKKGTE